MVASFEFPIHPPPTTPADAAAAATATAPPLNCDAVRGSTNDIQLPSLLFAAIVLPVLWLLPVLLLVLLQLFTLLLLLLLLFGLRATSSLLLLLLFWPPNSKPFNPIEVSHPGANIPPLDVSCCCCWGIVAPPVCT